MSIDIEKLDDATALHVLEALARAQPRAEVLDADQLSQSLTTLTSASAPAAPVSGADLARSTLVWLAQDPQQRRVIDSLVATPAAPTRFAFAPGLGALACVLLILKTKALIERDKDGRWHFKAELIELKQGPLGVVLDLFAKLAKKG